MTNYYVVFMSDHRFTMNLNIFNKKPLKCIFLNYICSKDI
jgi:hypothetical protein